MSRLSQVLALSSLPLFQIVNSIFGSGKIRVLRAIGQRGADWIEVHISRTGEDRGFPAPALRHHRYGGVGKHGFYRLGSINELRPICFSSGLDQHLQAGFEQ